ncbi:MAG: T9SS type A sorting domain-containing protein [Muribaculaceae bacterium]|nr:T9SS type A sorting domain-containing protein [Muribaculaceae bacterium]
MKQISLSFRMIPHRLASILTVASVCCNCLPILGAQNELKEQFYVSASAHEETNIEVDMKLKRDAYTNAVFIGSSFVYRVMNPSINWYRNGAMAPSISQHSLPNLVLQGLQATAPDCKMSTLSSVDWEQNYMNYDYDKLFGKSLADINPDAIFMHISGNSEYSEDFEGACVTLIQNIKTTVPSADLYIAASWHGGEKAEAFKNACEKMNVTYVDLAPLKKGENMVSAGDWYLVSDNPEYNGYYGISTSVAGHPNDMGCYRMANQYLSDCGYAPLQLTHNITLNTTGNGRATTPNLTWIQDGIVTIRIVSGKVQDISVVSGSGTKIIPDYRINDLNPNYTDYYTFTMPADNVICSVNFSDTDTGILNIESSDELYVANPMDVSWSRAAKSLNIKCPEECVGSTVLFVTDLNGIHHTLTIDQTEVSVSMADYSPGIYIVAISYDSKPAKTFKIIL